MARERATRQATAISRRRHRLSPSDIRDLIILMNRSDIHEITVEVNAETRLTLRKPQPVSLETVAYTGQAETATRERAAVEPAATPAPADKKLVAVKTPFVGVYRQAAKPRLKPFVSVGDMVEEGQIVAAVEALNLLNEVEAPVSGTVAEFAVKDGQAVEYGQPLVMIEP
jgi:acetyl-CoA carboxylase biotin carboxyl carrier protein